MPDPTPDDQQNTDGPKAPNVVPEGATVGGQTAPADTDSGQQKPPKDTDGKQAKPGLPDDPDALRAEIKRLRQENASDRTNAKKTAAETARKEMAQQIGKAIGLVDDEVDPAKLADDLTAATTAQKDSARQLAVYRAAAKAGANPDALLDSVSFLAAIGDIDPTGSDAPKAITDAITAAIEQNPKLRATPPTPDRSGGGQHHGGHQTQPPKTLQEAIAARMGG